MEQKRLGLHLETQQRTHTIDFCRKLILILNQWLEHPTPYYTILKYRSTPCLNTLMGSVRYPFTLLKYSVHCWIVELHPTFLHFGALPNPNTFFWILCYLIILLSNFQIPFSAEPFPISIYCSTMLNPNILFVYNKSLQTVEE